jgi:alkanesulfonate monooxygenase SsuD/methylene tetrahydromethanopterin reductase-like flavin-dependent oxidoreductase (luciferase family)
VPRLDGGAAVRAMAEAITLVRALSGGGDAVTFDGEFYHVDGLDPAAAPAPRVFTGSVGPKSLAVTGQLADGWIPPGGSDWLSELYRESRPRVDAAAVAAGRDPADIADVYNFGGRITAAMRSTSRGRRPRPGFSSGRGAATARSPGNSGSPGSRPAACAVG